MKTSPAKSYHQPLTKEHIVDHKAQGFVEVKSYVAAIETADAMAKAADVVIAMAHKVDGPDICVICEGDVAACKAAVNAGEAEAQNINMFLASNVIPRPEQGAGQLYELMGEMSARKAAKKAERIARREAVFARMDEEEQASEAEAEMKKTAPKKPAAKK